jgi:organic radical activating enzyme
MKIAKLSGKPEIFYSIQGEGMSSGIPSVFIRLSMCNLHCTWCDTDYTWNWEGTPFIHDNDSIPGYRKYRKEDQIIELTLKELVASIEKYPGNRLIITGGEPMMQQKEVAELIQLLKTDHPDYFVEIETNGTKIPQPSLDAVIDQYNVSVKLSNSGNPTSLRLKEPALTFFSQSPKSNFKFVIATPEDLNEVEQLRSDFKISGDKIILMPLGTDESALTRRESWLVDICKDRNYRFTDRMHIRLYGNKRGV